MKLTIKSIVLAASLALPTFFAGNVFAVAAPSTCGANCTSASANPHGYTSAMTVNCYGCHSMPATTPAPAPAPKPAPKPTTSPVVTPPATVAVTPLPTSKSCGACVKGTAPSSVSAHKNVNSTMTACSVCHGGSSSGGTTGGMTGGTTGGSTGGSTGSTTSSHSDDHGSTSSHSDDHGSKGSRSGRGNKNHDNDD